MSTLCALLLLLAPAPDRHWSEKHGVGVWFPRQWEILDRDAGGRVFVVQGPLTGPGRPRLVLWDAGPADTPLEKAADAVAQKIHARAGWRVATRARKRVGLWPCVRLGIRFVEGGGKGNARVSVLRMGNRHYVLELSAPASHFPGATFDRIEKSIDLRWKEHALEGGMVVEAPVSFAVERAGKALRITGPPVVIFEAESELTKPPSVKPGEKVRFLGEERETVVAERRMQGEPVRLLLVHAGGWSVAVMIPVKDWDDLFPVAEEILQRAHRKRAPKKRAADGRSGD